MIPLKDLLVEEATEMSDVNKQVEKWLDERWQQKEKQMEYFVEHQKYDDDWTANQVG